MNWLVSPIHWMRAHIPEIAVSLTAMALVVGGPYVNAGLKNLTRNFHWLVRYGIFIFLSMAGYGIISNIIQRNTRGFLLGLSNGQLVGAVLGLHLLLAWLLKREGKI